MGRNLASFPLCISITRCLRTKSIPHVSIMVRQFQNCCQQLRSLKYFQKSKANCHTSMHISDVHFLVAISQRKGDKISGKKKIKCYVKCFMYPSHEWSKDVLVHFAKPNNWTQLSRVLNEWTGDDQTLQAETVTCDEASWQRPILVWWSGSLLALPAVWLLVEVSLLSYLSRMKLFILS